MKIAEVMNLGYQITIQSDGKRNTGFSSATFWKEDGKIWMHNRPMGTFQNPNIDNFKLDCHIQQMIDEGFQVVLTKRN